MVSLMSIYSFELFAEDTGVRQGDRASGSARAQPGIGEGSSGKGSAAAAGMYILPHSRLYNKE